MATREIAFPVRVPSPVTVGLGIMAFTVTGKKLFSYNHRVAFSAGGRQYGQECRHRQEPDAGDRSGVCEWMD